ncbi:MAG: B12-binding domain-containing radical SAM protein [Blastocatellia bacterium]|nr:B12-binding domain-containing radical SAM protein [Blastocatellia bacterium]
MPSPKIVLTASASEASEFKHSIWQQMLSATIPDKFRKTFINPDSLVCESWPDGRAKYVPNGLRVVETLLLKDFSEADVVVCYHEYLDKFVGPETKIVGIHAHNPLGISYATDVYSKLGGPNLLPLNAAEFLKIVRHPAIEKYKPKIVIGGPGAWQLELANRMDEFRVDYLIKGEVERVLNDLLRRIMAGDPTVPRILEIPKNMQPTVEEIPVVKHRSTFGVVEITRGCGRGCQFCGPATKVGRSFPMDHIMASVHANVNEGATEIMLVSEDMFLYEQEANFVTNVPALENLFRQVKAVPGVETLQMTHITMAPVVKDPSIIERLTPLTVPYSHITHHESTAPNKCIVDPIIGLETGSPRLFDRYMKGKAYPYKANQWRDVILKGMEILNRHNWYPFCTFIIGLPGETDEDTKASLDLLYELRDAKGMFVPTWFVPLEDSRMKGKNSAKLIEMTDLQWEFFFTCWKYNVEFYRGGTFERYKYSMGVPVYYKMLGKKLFGEGMKYPLYRFAGFPEKMLRKHLYLDFSNHKRSPKGMQPFTKEIIPGFETIKGLNMVDATALKPETTSAAVAKPGKLPVLSTELYQAGD